MQQNSQNRPFCSDPLWDLNLTWYNKDPDFTHCFQSTVLIYVPVIFFASFLPFKFWKWDKKKKGSIPWKSFIGARIALNLALILINLIQFVIEMVWLDKMRPISNIVAPVVLVVTFLLATYVEVSMIYLSNGLIKIYENNSYSV